MDAEHIFMIIGGLAIFLLGMKHMSEGLQAISGDRLRKMIGAVTNNRLMGVLVGLAVTCLVQSSSVTTVMVVGFVNSGIMTLMQAIGVIFGANIGTTITGWILVLKVGKYGLPMLAIASFFFLFSKNERARYIGMTVMGIGMVFYGLHLMKDGFHPLKEETGFKQWFAAFNVIKDSGGISYINVIKCAAVGMVLTMVVQSSSATLGITISLACTGTINYATAAALVMGENIGTTITALLASIGTTTVAKRAAYAHFFFNVLGTTWFIALFPIVLPALAKLIEAKTGYNPLAMNIDDMSADKFGQVITAGIALTHTTFNVTNVVVFLPFAPLLAKLVTKIAPDKGTEEVGHLTYLDIRMLDTPSLGIVQSQKQLNFMAESVEEMMHCLRTCLEDGNKDQKLQEKIFHREEILDNVQKEIFLYLSQMVAGQVPQEITLKGHKQMRIADEYESLSDYITNVLKGIKKMEQNDLPLDGPALEKLLTLHDRVMNYITRVNKSMKAEKKDDLAWATAEGAGIGELMKEFRRQHLERLQKEEVSPFFSLAFTDMLNFYRRMKDHSLNIAEVIAGGK